MKKLTLIIAIALMSFTGFAQDCGTYIELKGAGMIGEEVMSLGVTDPGEVVRITAEAVYKSTTGPTKVKFWSDHETFEVEPVDVAISGYQPDDVFTAVYRAVFNIPAGEIHLDILDNPEEMVSMSLYIERPQTGITSSLEGELYHVFQNEDDPLILEIPVSESENPRDIGIRFGVSELNADERWAIFSFEANGVVKEVDIWEWDSDEGESESYTIQELLFENVPGEVDKIIMTMLSENYENGTRTGDSFIAGLVLIDTPCEIPESSGYCTYTQGFYGNEGGRTCQGMTTPELLALLLSEELVMGEGENSLVIGAGDVDCIIALLPGGGPSEALSGMASCGNLTGISTKKNGTVKNTLLAQGITLALNLRHSPDLLDFTMSSEEFTVYKIEDCESGEINMESGNTHAFSQEIVSYLGEGATLADLLDLVNHALGGGELDDLSLSQISDAASLVNEAFDECKAISGNKIGEVSNDQNYVVEGGVDDENDKNLDDGAGSKGVTGVDSDPVEAIKVFPNPVQNQLNIDIRNETGKVQAATLYNLSGKAVKILQVDELTGTLIQSDVSELLAGFYILKIETNSATLTVRLQKQ